MPRSGARARSAPRERAARSAPFGSGQPAVHEITRRSTCTRATPYAREHFLKCTQEYSFMKAGPGAKDGTKALAHRQVEQDARRHCRETPTTLRVKLPNRSLVPQLRSTRRKRRHATAVTASDLCGSRGEPWPEQEGWRRERPVARCPQAARPPTTRLASGVLFSRHAGARVKVEHTVGV